MSPEPSVDRVELRLADDGGIRHLGLAGGPTLVSTAEQPGLVLHLLERGRLREVSSASARTFSRDEQSDADGTTHTFRYGDLDGTGIDATLTVRIPAAGRLTTWGLTVTQPAGVVVADVQYPYVVAPYARADSPTELLYPYRDGFLYPSIQPAALEADHPSVWSWENDTDVWHHYPGSTIAPFLAYLRPEGGIHLACHDTTGHVKHVKAVHHSSGHLRLVLCHVVGRTQPGTWTVPYEVVLGTFSGDWHASADLYRDWYAAHAAPTRLSDRTDVPAWLLDSPLHVVLRAAGTDDAAPTDPNPEVVPYQNVLPALDAVAAAAGVDVLPLLTGFEGPGPWVHPHSLPPVGGDASLRAFASAVRGRGWHLGAFANGTHWVTEHKWSGYDGRDAFERDGGPQTVCRRPDGDLWGPGWDLKWRTSWYECLAVPETTRQLRELVDGLAGMGFDWIQLLDQNCGVSTFPCYSADHGHDPAPGPWMTDRMDDLLGMLDEVSREAPEPIAWSVERPPNDHHLGRLHSCDSRPNLRPGSNRLPLQKYLFHEYGLSHSSFGFGPTTHWMLVKTAYACVLGDIPGAILARDGRVQTYGGGMWPPWDVPYDDEAAVLELLGKVCRLRRDEGREALAYGRMLPDQPAYGIAEATWTDATGDWSYPAVTQAAWLTPDGTRTLALCNWTSEPQPVQLAPTWRDGTELRLGGETGAYEVPPLTPVVLA